MLRQGYSWSGRERNCCFLNVDGERFADVSAVTGLNFADDGRGLALVDWDFDGDVDLWTTNRTGPRLRFMRNDNEGAGTAHYLALRLEGDGRTSNRDAIGARVEVFAVGEPPRRWVRSVRAGEGFISQSSKWLHFGLGKAKLVDKAVVHWPGGASETFTNLKTDHHYLLRQHSGAAEIYTPPRSGKSLVPSPLHAPLQDERARIVLIGRVPLPNAAYRGLRGEDRRLIDDARARPLLVNLWSYACAPCLLELDELTEHHNELRQRGVSIVALSVDRLTEAAAGAASAAQYLSTKRLPFATGFATENTASQLESVQRAVLDRSRPLPLPSSFLIDRQGRVAVIYKGSLRVEQLIDDLSLLNKAASEVRDLAVPFPGRWRTMPADSDPVQVALKLFENGHAELAEAYLMRCETIYRARASDARAPLSSEKLAAMSYFHGSLLLEDGDVAGAIEKYESAVAIDPSRRDAHLQLGKLFKQQHEFRNAANHFGEAAQLDPRDAAVRYQLATCLTREGDYSRAVAEYRAALQLRPGWIPAANNLAWILATHKDDAIRNPEEAVRLAEQVCEATSKSDPTSLDTLAVAYAAAGKREEAIEILNRALSIAESRNQDALAASLRSRLGGLRNQNSNLFETP